VYVRRLIAETVRCSCVNIKCSQHPWTGWIFLEVVRSWNLP